MTKTINDCFIHGRFDGDDCPQCPRETLVMQKFDTRPTNTVTETITETEFGSVSTYALDVGDAQIKTVVEKVDYDRAITEVKRLQLGTETDRQRMIAQAFRIANLEAENKQLREALAELAAMKGFSEIMRLHAEQALKESSR